MLWIAEVRYSTWSCIPRHTHIDLCTTSALLVAVNIEVSMGCTGILYTHLCVIRMANTHPCSTKCLACAVLEPPRPQSQAWVPVRGSGVQAVWRRPLRPPREGFCRGWGTPASPQRSPSLVPLHLLLLAEGKGHSGTVKSLFVRINAGTCTWC